MMFLRQNDKVIMLQGKDRGKTGTVIRVLPQAGKVVVQGLNTIKKHQRPRQQGQKGQIITKERAVDSSNVQLVCPSCNKPSRFGHVLSGDKKIRSCKRCQASL